MQSMFDAATLMGLLTTSELLSFIPSTRQKPMSAFQLLKTKYGKNYNSLLDEWFRSNAGCHDASCGEEKGDLLRWKEIEGVRTPTIRRDMVETVLAGKVIVKDDQDLRAFISAHL